MLLTKKEADEQDSLTSLKNQLLVEMDGKIELFCIDNCVQILCVYMYQGSLQRDGRGRPPSKI